jgi:hypothetical protein
MIIIHGIGVQRRVLHVLSVPRRADLHASIGRVDIQERGHAHRAGGS